MMWFLEKKVGTWAWQLLHRPCPCEEGTLLTLPVCMFCACVYTFTDRGAYHRTRSWSFKDPSVSPRTHVKEHALSLPLPTSFIELRDCIDDVEAVDGLSICRSVSNN